MNILFTWELGGGYGHLAGFTSLARALLDEGYTISAAVKNINDAARVFGDLPISLYQAPIFRHPVDEKNVTHSYPEIIKQLGFENKQTLKPLTQSWLNLISLIKPTLIIADHSPIALVAARIMGIKTTLIGTGFFSPPRVFPMPQLVGLPPASQERILINESAVLKSINEVYKEHSKAPLDYLYQLFDVDTDFLCTFEELDHYTNRPSPQYWGPRFDISIGRGFEWPKDNAKKLFVYIRQNTPEFDRLLKIILSSPFVVVAHIPDADENVKSQFANAKNKSFLDYPAKMEQVFKEADLVICNAGHGLVSACLLAGIRMVLVPTQLEQSIVAYLIGRRKLAAAINSRQANFDFQGAIEFALNSKILGQKLAEFKKKYRDFNNKDQINDMVSVCKSLTS